MMILGGFIKDLHVEEELLIKWTLLNFISSRLIDEIKNERSLLIYIQFYVKHTADQFSDWVNENEPYGIEGLEDTIPLNNENFKKLFDEFKKDPNISEILREGTHEFTSENIADYIFLSSITPKEPLVIIEANRDSFILGHSISFSGKCIDAGEKVRLMLSGPGIFSNGPVEIATPKVLGSNKWNYTWAPSYSIQPGSYTAYVFDVDKKVSDQLLFSVYKGAVTIVAGGNQSYYLGEKVKFSGTCTAGDSVYLSIAFPDPHTQTRRLDQISLETLDNDPNTFVKIDVKSDYTWEYEWDTSKITNLMNAGTYTVFACEGPFIRNNLENKAYATVSIILKKPFLSATASHSVVAQGDVIYITGTAEGEPKQGVQIWIFGEDNCLIKTRQVNVDSSFSLGITGSETKKMDAGQYFVIVQHPMMNNEFDVYLDADKQNVLSNYPKKGTELFSIVGQKRKTGAEAALELINAISNPNIDDTYTKLQFLVEKPVIAIDIIGDMHFGAKFTITAQTNLAVDDEVLFQVYSSMFEAKLYQKMPPGEFSGISGTVKVLRGDSGLNKLEFYVDASTFSPGKYIVIANAVSQDANARILFNIKE
jgi:hypothetical protein